jgi:hypothetical protein
MVELRKTAVAALWRDAAGFLPGTLEVYPEELVFKPRKYYPSSLLQIPLKSIQELEHKTQTQRHYLDNPIGGWPKLWPMTTKLKGYLIHVRFDQREAWFKLWEDGPIVFTAIHHEMKRFHPS